MTKISDPGYLLDVNVLVALAHPIHIHHKVCHGWMSAHSAEGWATCPITENGLVRLISSPLMGASRYDIAEALTYLESVKALPTCSFLPDAVSIVGNGSSSQLAYGHQQITDAYLIDLCRFYDLKLVTLDRKVRQLQRVGEDLVVFI